MRRLLATAAISAVALSGSVRAESVCSLSHAEFAAALRTMTTWSEISAFHKRHFPACPDDGFFAEGYSDLVVRTLANNWTSLPELAREAQRRPTLHAFVVKHVDASASPGHLKVIRERAASRCPTGHRALCAALGKAAELALAELR